MIGKTTYASRIVPATILIVLALVAVAGAQTCVGPGGCLDLTFNGTGKQVIVTSGSGSTIDRDSIVLPNGKIISLIDNRFTGHSLIGLNADGTLDGTFGVNGSVYTTWHYPNGYAYGIALQNVGGEDRLLIAGSWDIPQGRKIFHALRVDRYLLNGTIDTSFGTNGSVVINANYPLAVAVQPADQKILTVGDLGTLVRLNPNGSLDTTFGTGGKVEIGQSGWALKALSDGKILVSGTSTQGSSSPMAVMRFNPNGSVDTSFGTNGRAVALFFGNGSFGRAFTVDLDPFGNIIAGGIARPKNTLYNDFAAARFTPSGQPDSAFNGNGKVTYGFAGLNDQGRGIVAQSDGKLVVTGAAELATGIRDWALVRFNLDGSLDTTFGNNGTATVDLGGNSEFSKTVRIWFDPSCACEKIVMVGGTTVGAGFARFTTQ